MLERPQISNERLRLPHPFTPRPGEKVVWFNGQRKHTGTYLGYNGLGTMKVRNEFGTAAEITSYFQLRVENPFERLHPNWCRLNDNSIIYEVLEEELVAFDRLLDGNVPGGITYIEIVNEIWYRGFEVFVVGGTVRDILSGDEPNDVDIVTTMPLFIARDLFEKMLTNPDIDTETGILRLGGKRQTPDPFVDLKVFCDDYYGEANALFGDNFEKDIRRRDFSCNSIFYEPVNRVIIDPCGHGIADIEAGTLKLVCTRANLSKPAMAQISIRFLKFLLRGYTADTETTEEIIVNFMKELDSLRSLERLNFMRSELFNKNSREENLVVFESIRQFFSNWQKKEIFEDYFEKEKERLVKILPESL